MSLVALLTQTEAALSDPGVYQAHYLTLRKWIYDSMDEYRQELSRALYPLAAHAYLDLVRRGLAPAAAQLLAVVRNDSILSAVHRDDLINLVLFCFNPLGINESTNPLGINEFTNLLGIDESTNSLGINESTNSLGFDFLLTCIGEHINVFSAGRG